MMPNFPISDSNNRFSGLNLYFEFVLAYSSIYHKAMARSVDEPLYATLPWLSQADFEHLIVAKVSIARELSYFMSRSGPFTTSDDDDLDLQ